MFQKTLIKTRNMGGRFHIPAKTKGNKKML